MINQNSIKLNISKSKIHLPFILASVFFFHGCIEITERIDVREDRSGRFSLTMSVFQQNLFSRLLSLGGSAEILDEAEAIAWQASLDLQNRDGIHNIQFINDKRNGTIGLAFDFDSHRHLNSALYALAGERKTMFKPAIYRIRSGVFNRRNITTFIELLLEEDESEMIADWITFTTEINLPRPVKSVSHKKARVLNEGNRIKTSDYLSGIVENGTSTRIRIRY
jgi:hypothetical protein